MRTRGGKRKTKNPNVSHNFLSSHIQEQKMPKEHEMKFRKPFVWRNRSISNKRLRKPASTEHRDPEKVT